MRSSFIAKSLLFLSFSVCVNSVFAENTNKSEATLIKKYAPYSDPTNQGGWLLNTAISDEFDGDSINLDKWYVQGLDGQYQNRFQGRAPSQFVPHAISQENGHLTITTRWEPDFAFSSKINNGRKYENITTGGVITKGKFKHGYMETRAKAADGPISSSFWSTGKGGEIDVFEHWGENKNNPDSAYRYHTSFHDWRTPKTETFSKRIWTNNHELDFRVADDFHVWGLEWAPTYLKIYVDNNLVRCITKAEMGDKWVATNEQKVWLDSEVFPWEGNPDKLSAADYPDGGRKFVIDYVRVWQRDENQYQKGCEQQTNYVVNGSFESDLSGWNTTAKTASVASQGDSSAYLASKGKVEQTVSVKPNTTYILSAWVKLPGTNMKNIWHNAWLGVQFDGEKARTKKAFKNKFHRQSIQFTTGPNTKTASIFVSNEWSGHAVYIDNVELVESAITSSID